MGAWRFLIWVLIAAGLLSGCTFNHTLNTTRGVLTDLQLLEQRRLVSGRDWVAPRNSAWMVAVSRDGPDRLTDQKISRQLAASMRQTFAHVVLAAEPKNLAGALQLARHNQSDFMIYPQLLHAGDGAYSLDEWTASSSALSSSGAAESESKAIGRDWASVKLLIYDVHSGRLLDTVVLEIKESWLPGIHGDADQLYAHLFDVFAQSYSYQRAELPN